MQPTLTQVPPSAAASASTTRAPRWAASRAARTPPLPPPMTNRSQSNPLIPAPLLAGPLPGRLDCRPCLTSLAQPHDYHRPHDALALGDLVPAREPHEPGAGALGGRVVAHHVLRRRDGGAGAFAPQLRPADPLQPGQARLY